MKPPMIPHAGRAIDTINFRNVKESQSSVDMGAPNTFIGAAKGSGPRDADFTLGGEGKGAKTVREIKGVPLDSGLETPGGEVPDPFEEFNSVTLHHEGEDEGGG